MYNSRSVDVSFRSLLDVLTPPLVANRMATLAYLFNADPPENLGMDAAVLPLSNCKVRACDYTEVVYFLDTAGQTESEGR